MLVYGIPSFKLEKDVAKYDTDIQQLDKEINMEIQKQDDEVARIYNDVMSSAAKGPDTSQNDDTIETEQDEQAKMLEKQLHKLEVDLKKLKAMKPTKELNDIQSLLEQYKKQLNL